MVNAEPSVDSAGDEIENRYGGKWTVACHIDTKDELGEATDWYAWRNPFAAMAIADENREQWPQLPCDPFRLPSLGPER